MASVKVKDNSGKVKSEYDRARERSLEAIGLTAVGYAVKLVKVRSHTLRNGIKHLVDGKSVMIGTDVPWGKWNEFGTGIYAEKGDGRQTPWVYKDADGFHWTRGMRPRPFLRPAATEHLNTYKQIIQNEFAKIK